MKLGKMQELKAAAKEIFENNGLGRIYIKDIKPLELGDNGTDTVDYFLFENRMTGKQYRIDKNNSVEEMNCAAAKLETLAQIVKTHLLQAATRTMDHITYKDAYRNHINSGMVIGLALVLRELGYEVDEQSWQDGEYLKIEQIVIDGTPYRFNF